MGGRDRRIVVQGQLGGKKQDLTSKKKPGMVVHLYHPCYVGSIVMWIMIPH
jgi:hypothetical protein